MVIFLQFSLPVVVRVCFLKVSTVQRIIVPSRDTTFSVEMNITYRDGHKSYKLEQAHLYRSRFLCMPNLSGARLNVIK